MTTTTYATADDAEAAMDKGTTEYGGYVVKGGIERVGNRWEPVYRITRNGANVAPGATYFATHDDAMQAIDVLVAVDGDAQRFWHLWRAVRPRQTSGTPAAADQLDHERAAGVGRLAAATPSADDLLTVARAYSGRDGWNVEQVYLPTLERLAAMLAAGLPVKELADHAHHLGMGCCPIGRMRALAGDR